MRRHPIRIEVQHLQSVHARRTRQRDVRLAHLEHAVQVHPHELQRLALRLVDAERPREDERDLGAGRELLDGPPAVRPRVGHPPLDGPLRRLAQLGPRAAVRELEADDRVERQAFLREMIRGSGWCGGGARFLVLFVAFVVPATVEERVSVREADDAAQGAVHEGRVDVLDEHNLRGCFQCEDLGGDAVGQEPLARSWVGDDAAVFGEIGFDYSLDLLHPFCVGHICFTAEREEISSLWAVVGWRAYWPA